MPLDQLETILDGGPAPVSRFYFSQRLRLHYLDWGNESAPPLLLVHGWRDHCHNWDWLASRLRKDFHVIAPDLRGHGDSGWQTEGSYPRHVYSYDLAQLIDQQKLSPVTIIAHSNGANLSLRYAGTYPETVKKIVAIEGLGTNPQARKREDRGIVERMHEWIEGRRNLSRRAERRFASVEEAYVRMKEANKNFSDERAWHLTLHGVTRNEDGTYSWKFDPYLRSWAPYDMPRPEVKELWSLITCPALLIGGTKSSRPDPRTDGSAAYFQNAQVAMIENAGHWPHHDQFETVLQHITDFLNAP